MEWSGRARPGPHPYHQGHPFHLANSIKGQLDGERRGPQGRGMVEEDTEGREEAGSAHLLLANLNLLLLTATSELGGRELRLGLVG